MSDRNKGCEQSTFRPYLTPEQLAVRLQVSREYVYRELLGQPDGIPAMKNRKRAPGSLAHSTRGS